ncbi:MAG: sulfatase-like hydrolase/transferase [Armatimonadota bacterium]
MREPPSDVLILLTDDHRADALGCAGHPLLRTPNIDRLASEGTRFENAFVTTAICCASRAAILTGQYNRRNGIHEFNVPLTPAQHAASYPGRLRSAGYRIGYVGKYGVGDGHPPPADRYDYWRGFAGQGVYETPAGHLTDVMTRQAVEFLETGDQRPSCLCVAYKAPHAEDLDPRQYIPAPRHRDSLADGSVPAVRSDDFDRLPPYLRTSEGRVRWQARFATPSARDASVRDILRLIAGVDESVGAIVETLRRTRRLDRTLIVFLGDNGAFLGEHGLADKWTLHEESARVPCIVRDPRAPEGARGRVRSEMALNIDIAPTVLEAAGLRPDRAMQGRSLLPLAHGHSPAWRTDWFYEHLFRHPGIPRSEGVRTTTHAYWRFIDKPAPNEFCHDLRVDPEEVVNLAGSPAHAALVAKLRARTAEYARSLA